MGYTITIGEYEPDFYIDGLNSVVKHSAAYVELSNAPAFGEPSDNYNFREPSYGAWVDFPSLLDYTILCTTKTPGFSANTPAACL